MRKILSSRLFRCMICLILVCCFLVNASPIRAKATGVGTAALYALGVVAVEVVVAAAFQALGVMSGSDSTTFKSYVNDAVTWLTNSTSYVTNGMVQVLGFMSPDGVVKSFAMKDMVQAVWEWLFSSGTVSSANVQFSDSANFLFNGLNVTIASAVPAFCFLFVNQYNGMVYGIAMSSSETLVTAYDGDTSVFSTTTQTTQSGYYWSIFTSGFLDLSLYSLPVIYGESKNTGGWRLFEDVYEYLSFSPNTIYDLHLGQIQSPYLTTGTDEETIQIEIAPIYVDWTTGQISQRPSSNDDEKIWLPLGVPSTDLDEIITQNQDQAQSGDTSLDFDFETSTDSDTGTDPDSGGGSGDNTGTGTNTGSGSWTPPSDMGKFTLDLKDYFPFCIPFDLYDFFVCLNADPVAPVIEWVIPLPGGETYPLEIDLSVFDPVAQVLRRLQLLLFCVGLAFKTRDLIKG